MLEMPLLFAVGIDPTHFAFALAGEGIFIIAMLIGFGFLSEVSAERLSLLGMNHLTNAILLLIIANGIHLGIEYSSASGYQKVLSQIEPQEQKGGAGCGA